MNITKTDLPGVLLVEPNIFGDERGFFVESFHAKRYGQANISGTFVQDNMSFSKHGVIRGLHFQHPQGQGRLVYVLTGAVIDVTVDIRRQSPTFAQSVSVELSADNRRQLWIPAGFAHGFCVISETALLTYKCTDYYNPATERSILWNDPQLGIAWPTLTSPSLSKKDAAAPLLADLPLEHLPLYCGD